MDGLRTGHADLMFRGGFWNLKGLVCLSLLDFGFWMLDFFNFYFVSLGDLQLLI
jgi:hypothetical protein